MKVQHPVRKSKGNPGWTHGVFGLIRSALICILLYFCSGLVDSFLLSLSYPFLLLLLHSFSFQLEAIGFGG